ncbi:MAG: hypothetical protein ACREFD_14805 [Stellaceae bacterium]
MPQTVGDFVIERLHQWFVTKEMAAFMASAHADAHPVDAAWSDPLAADRPTVIEFKADPEVPSLPPHITLKRAKPFTGTLIAGDPDKRGVIVGTTRELLATVLPGSD